MRRLFERAVCNTTAASAKKRGRGGRWRWGDEAARRSFWLFVCLFVCLSHGIKNTIRTQTMAGTSPKKLKEPQ
jgi:hypothetical protein